MEQIKMMMTDVETAGSLTEPFTYDIGACAIDRYGNPLAEPISHVTYEVFYGMKDKMQSAYYAHKLPQYRDEIWEGEREVMDFLMTRERICNQMKELGIHIVVAHNARFDINALNNTIRTLTNGRIKFFFPYGTEVWDTYKMARQVFKEMPSYRKFCEQYGFMTNHKTPRPRYTAEVIYRFITKDPTFTEAHTGLADVKIESEILAYLMKKPKCDRVLYHAPVSEKAEEEMRQAKEAEKAETKEKLQEAKKALMELEAKELELHRKYREESNKAKKDRIDARIETAYQKCMRMTDRLLRLYHKLDKLEK